VAAGQDDDAGAAAPKAQAKVEVTPVVAASKEVAPAPMPAPAPAVAPPAPKAAAPERPQKPRLVAKVETVQSPAWVDRRGVRASVKPGWALLAGDRLTTGPDGRAELTLPGSAKLKVGGDTSVQFAETSALGLQPVGAERKLLRLNKGIVQFAAPTMARAGLGPLSITLGDSGDAKVINGQIFTRVSNGETVVGLIDGVTEVRGAGFNEHMDKPESFVTIPAGGKPRPVTDIAKEKLAWWLSQVDTVHDRAVLVAGGGWDVGLRTGYDLQDLRDTARMLQAKGFPSEVTSVQEPGRRLWYRLAVRRFATENDARMFSQALRGLGFKDAWVMPPA
jgi:hypothetical protein